MTDLADPVMFSDPYPRYAELRSTAPVSSAFSKQLLGGTGYMLTRHEHVLLLHNDVRFSSDPTSQGSSFLIRHLPRMFRLLMSSMVYRDDPDHARLRRLVNKAFTPRRVQQMTGEIERIVAELLDKAEQRGTETIDLVNDVAVPLPLSVISRMLGVDDEDRDQFHVLVERFVDRLGSGSAADAMRAVPTARKLYAVLERLADQRRAEPDDGLISALLEASEDGDSLSSDEVIAMIFLLMLAGHDTTANLIGSSAVALIEHPEEAERLRAEPALMPTAVEELLRYTTPVPCGAARTLLEDVEVEGTTMPKGSKVLGMIISANRDELVFDRPDDLDLGREPNRHLTFAFGKHFCLGNQLARLEGQIAIGELVRRFPGMHLAVPRKDLRYKPVQSLRGFRSLPLRLR
ncbi:MAG TPA: cytochrome P450 [Acidimicrobiales bacterium]|nr:cytochrome P450 [Acidimicrobiales bacterium]